MLPESFLWWVKLSPWQNNGSTNELVRKKSGTRAIVPFDQMPPNWAMQVSGAGDGGTREGTTGTE
jgi:hypothetical protein